MLKRLENWLADEQHWRLAMAATGGAAVIGFLEIAVVSSVGWIDTGTPGIWFMEAMWLLTSAAFCYVWWAKRLWDPDPPVHESTGAP